MQTDFIRKLLDLADAYESGGGNTGEFDQEDFVSWLITGQQQRTREAAEPASGPPVNGLIAMYLSFMARYAQFYSRRVFRDTVGVFESDDVHDGKPIKVRGIWDNITATTCRWHQTVSDDGGTTWKPNWFMDWKRV